MSNTSVAGRSNYVKIKDMEGLKKSLEIFTHLSIVSDNDGKHCILAEYDSFFVQSVFIGEEEEEEVELQIETHIIPFLEDNEIFIFMEVQNEKLRWIYGYAEAYQGNKRLAVSLEDIYDMVKKEWKTDEYTTAQY